MKTSQSDGICDACECVEHCLKNGCIPLQLLPEARPSAAAAGNAAKRFFNRIAAFLFVVLVAITIAGTGIHLDGVDDIRAAQDQSDALTELQATKAGTARREKAAQRLCTETVGANSEARWTEDGDLVCTTRRGARNMQQARL